ncbi:MAG TPA: DUF1232 domain-containing protein [Candidatus Limnocylindrales bacterium]|jgi:uncharacterized membrane protein YkvA (DUF1232 family)|nr:DUF1232 domain-containing protein [Candidatus Limnocylindrales bacterium]
MSEDPFPRERVGAMVRRMPAYVRLAWRLGKDPLLSKARRAAVVAAAGYLASPVDLVPGVIPVIGQLDDIAFALAAIRLALGGLDAERRREHLEAVGLADEHLAADLRTVGATSLWLARAGFRTTKKAAVVSAKAAGATARTTRAAAERAAPAAQATGRTAKATGRAAKAAADRAAPSAMATGRAAKDAATSAAETGRRVAGAAASALGRVSIPGRKPPTITVREVELPRLPTGGEASDSQTPD